MDFSKKTVLVLIVCFSYVANACHSASQKGEDANTEVADKETDSRTGDGSDSASESEKSTDDDTEQTAVEDSSSAPGDSQQSDDEETEEEVDWAAIYAKNRKICDEATNEKDCGRIDYRLDESDCFDDCGHRCAWMEFIEVSEKDGDRCVFGAQKGFCVFQSTGGDNPDPWWQDIPGCGRVAFQPSFVEEEGTIFVGQPERLMEAPDVKVQPCSFNAQGGTPAECDCLCDWPLESRLECDWIKGICLDTYTDLYWASRLDGTVAVGPVAANAACDNLEFAGFDDWRLPTLEELSTAVRGCPQGESSSSCPIISKCSSLDCADASCSYCDASGQPAGLTCPGPDCLNPDCKGCVAFGEGACASCENLQGPGYKGCYRAANLDWVCTTFWSSTKGDDLGPDGQPRYWGIDFARGGRFLSSWWVETKDGGITIENRPFACVRP